jgi:hypothetical protein
VLTTEDQIEIDVHDDAPALARLLTLPAEARLEALAELNGISAFDQRGMSRLKEVHESGDGFRVHVDDASWVVRGSTSARSCRASGIPSGSTSL